MKTSKTSSLVCALLAGGVLFSHRAQGQLLGGVVEGVVDTLVDQATETLPVDQGVSLLPGEEAVPDEGQTAEASGDTLGPDPSNQGGSRTPSGQGESAPPPAPGSAPPADTAQEPVDTVSALPGEDQPPQAPADTVSSPSPNQEDTVSSPPPSQEEPGLAPPDKHQGETLPPDQGSGGGEAHEAIAPPEDQGSDSPAGAEGDTPERQASEATASEDSSFALGLNYPNPFNPTTTIPYRLSRTFKVRLAVYNALGQQVRTLVEAAQGPGRYRVEWDGRDSRGRRLPSGLYLYRLEAGDQAVSRKMVFPR